MSTTEISVLDIATGSKRVLMQSAYGAFNGFGAAWSPDGRRAVVGANPGTKGYESGGLWLLDVDSGTATYLTEGEGAAWSPDGTTLAIAELLISPGKGSQGVKVRLMDLRTMTSREIFSDSSLESFAGLSWSPDGRRLVTSLANGISSTVYVLDIQTGAADPITAKNNAVSPQWSPDGLSIVYGRSSTSDATYTLKAYLVSPDGQCEESIPHANFVLSPTWSPDGRELAFIGPDESTSST